MVRQGRLFVVKDIATGQVHMIIGPTDFEDVMYTVYPNDTQPRPDRLVYTEAVRPNPEAPMSRIQVQATLKTVMKPNSRMLLDCYPQAVFKPFVLRFLADSPGVQVFITGVAHDVMQSDESILLDDTGLDKCYAVGDLMVFHLTNSTPSSVPVHLRVDGYTVEPGPKEVHDPDRPLVAYEE